MATFKTLGIKRIEKRFSGTKISSIEKLVGKDFKLLDFEICPSIKKSGGTYLKMQVLVDGEKRFCMTGGKFLQMVLSQIDAGTLKKDPIETKILRENGAYFFEGTVVKDGEKYDENEEVEMV